MKLAPISDNHPHHRALYTTGSMISSASSEAPLIVWLLKVSSTYHFEFYGRLLILSAQLPSTTTWKDLKDRSRPFMIEQPGEAWVFTDDKGLRWGTVTCRCVADAHSLIGMMH
jgi:hypothetical protein